jgi:hypothetical protein
MFQGRIDCPVVGSQIQATFWVAMAAEYGQQWHNYRVSNRVGRCNDESDVHFARVESQRDGETILMCLQQEPVESAKAPPLRPASRGEDIRRGPTDPAEQ